MSKNTLEKYILREYRPSASLNWIIDEFYEFDFRKDKKLNANPYFFPNYTTALVYYTDNISGESDFYLVGPCIKNVFLPFSGNCHYWAVDFHPFIARSFFKFNISSLLDKVLKAKDLINTEDYTLLFDSFIKYRTGKSRMKFFEKYVLNRIDEIKKPDKEQAGVIDFIIKTGGKVKLKDIYDTIQTSTRQFQRKFREETGLTPKEFCRIVRIRSAANKLAEGEYRHLDVMFESGYYDQSHYNKEFKELSGVTPSSFEKRFKRIKRTRPLR